MHDNTPNMPVTFSRDIILPWNSVLFKRSIQSVAPSAEDIVTRPKHFVPGFLALVTTFAPVTWTTFNSNSFCIVTSFEQTRAVLLQTQTHLNLTKTQSNLLLCLNVKNIDT